MAVGGCGLDLPGNSGVAGRARSFIFGGQAGEVLGLGRRRVVGSTAAEARRRQRGGRRESAKTSEEEED